MPFTCIRQATEEDIERLQAAADRFLKRYPYLGWPENHDALGVVNACYDQDQQIQMTYWTILWRKCARRALRHPRADQIAYNHVGYNVP